MEKLPKKVRIECFVELGKHISQLLEETSKTSNGIYESVFFNAHNQNTWFSRESVLRAFKGIEKFLDAKVLKEWLDHYTFNENTAPKIIGTVMAGNIPMVGFHDMLSILLSGNILKAKLSSADTYLMKYLASQIIKNEPRFEQYILFAENLKEIDALIATGSDNTARHFDYYFRDKPRIIRRNRTACAVLKGDESTEALEALAKDVFYYYGLGCRNVTKLYVPSNYAFEPMLKVFETLGKQAMNNHKYANNYDYNKSILLVNGIPHLDNGYLLLKEDESLFSAISTLYYERYEQIEDVEKLLHAKKEQVQCIVSENGSFPNSVAFGYAQAPEITDYADGIDTMEFLSRLK